MKKGKRHYQKYLMSDKQSAAFRISKPRRLYIAELITVCFILCKSHFPLGLQCLVIHHGYTVWVSLQIVSI